MSINRAVHLKLSRTDTMMGHVARLAAGALVDREIVIREAGYRTRVSAARDAAGCATKRSFAIGRHTRRIGTHGVHVAKRTVTHRTFGFSRAPDSD